MFLDFLTVPPADGALRRAGGRPRAGGRMRPHRGPSPQRAPSSSLPSSTPPPLIETEDSDRVGPRGGRFCPNPLSRRTVGGVAGQASRNGPHRRRTFAVHDERSPKNQEIKYRYSRPLFSRRIRLRSNRLFRAFWETRSERPSSLWTSAVVTPSGWLDNSKMRGPSWIDPF